MSEEKIKAELRSAENLNVELMRQEESKHFGERIERMKKTAVVYFDGRFPLAREPFKYMWEASRCYSFGLFLSAIALASAMVESAWNVDPRMVGTKKLKRIQGWISLNSYNAVAARFLGLPINELLDLGEREMLSYSTDIR